VLEPLRSRKRALDHAEVGKKRIVAFLVLQEKGQQALDVVRKRQPCL